MQHCQRNDHAGTVVVCRWVEPVMHLEDVLALCPLARKVERTERAAGSCKVFEPHREQLGAGILRVAPPSIEVTGGDHVLAHTAVVETEHGIGVDEVDPARMESRICPGLYLVGEILDVDGRLGGFNFQWAWSSAWVAAQAMAR